jgi:hypothetical protein
MRWLERYLAEGTRRLPRFAEVAAELVHLYAERGSPKYEKAAMRWLERYLAEGTRRLPRFAEVAADLTRREPQGVTNLAEPPFVLMAASSEVLRTAI